MKVELIDIRARMLTNSTTFELEQQQEQHHRLASSSASAWMREEDAAVDVGVSINNSPPPLYVTPIYDEERKAEDRIGHRHRRALFASSSSLSTKSRHRLGALAAFLVILTLVFFNCFSVQRLAADLIAQLRPRNQTETINKRTENEAEKNNNSQMAEGIWCFFLHLK